MKPLLVITAALEMATGLALLVVPQVVVSMLLGSALDTPVGFVVARVAGAAVLALGAACWLARHNKHGAAKPLVAAMWLYNTAVVAVFLHARLSAGLCGVGLWPAILVHLSLAVWCVACLRRARAIILP